MYGSTIGAEFGKGVAISADGNIVAVGSPGANTVQVFHKISFDGQISWPQKGNSITPTDENEINFGFRVGLSYDGMSLAISAPSSNSAPDDSGNVISSVGAIYVYDWDTINEAWKAGVSVAYGTTENQKLGIRGVAINPIEFSVHAVDDNGARLSYKVCQNSIE